MDQEPQQPRGISASMRPAAQSGGAPPSPRQPNSSIFVYVRIQKIFLTTPSHSRLTLHEALRPENSGVYTPLIPLSESNMYTSSTILALSTIPSRQSQLTFIINEFRQNFGDIEVFRLVLPLFWFPIGRVVTYAFPMITRYGDESLPMVLLDVHLAHGQVGPFAAPAGKLRVVPTWPIPPSMQSAIPVQTSESQGPPPEQRDPQPPQPTPSPPPPVPQPTPSPPPPVPQPTHSPPQPTYPPLQPTYPPLQATYPPLQATYPSLQSPYSPLQSTYPPLQPTYAPVQPTYAPVQSTYPSVQPTYPPLQPTYPTMHPTYPPTRPQPTPQAPQSAPLPPPQAPQSAPLPPPQAPRSAPPPPPQSLQSAPPPVKPASAPPNLTPQFSEDPHVLPSSTYGAQQASFQGYPTGIPISSLIPYEFFNATTEEKD